MISKAIPRRHRRQAVTASRPENRSGSSQGRRAPRAIMRRPRGRSPHGGPYRRPETASPSPSPSPSPASGRGPLGLDQLPARRLVGEPQAGRGPFHVRIVVYGLGSLKGRGNALREHRDGQGTGARRAPYRPPPTQALTCLPFSPPTRLGPPVPRTVSGLPPSDWEPSSTRGGSNNRRLRA